MDVQLAPVNPPLGAQVPNNRLYSPYPMTLVLRQKLASWSQGDFYVQTVNEQPILRVQGKTFSIHNKITFAYADIDQEIFTLQQELMHLHKTFHGASPDGAHDFHIKWHIKFIGSKATCTFTNASTGQPAEIEFQGNWTDRKGEFFCNGQLIATSTRDFLNARQLLFGNETYYLNIAPNVDASLLVAICVSLDEKEQEDRN